MQRQDAPWVRGPRKAFSLCVLCDAGASTSEPSAPTGAQLGPLLSAPGRQPPTQRDSEATMASSTGLLLLLLPLLLSVQPQAGGTADQEAVVCAGTACYTAHRHKLSAEDAQLHCSKKGGNLATVKSEEEAWHIQRALTQLLLLGAPLQESKIKFWIGLQREKGTCSDSSLPLRGFSWLGGLLLWGIPTSHAQKTAVSTPNPQPSVPLPLVTHEVQLSPALSEIPHSMGARAENLLPKT